MLLIYRWILKLQPSTNIQRRLEKDNICMWIRLIFLQSYAFWSKKCTCSIFKNCGKKISRIYLQKNGIIFRLLDNILYAERSLQMDKAHVGTMLTNPTISEHKEMHIINSYRDTIRTHCMQRRHQGRLCKNKNYSRLKTTNEPKISQGTTWSYRILQEIYKTLLIYDLSIGRTIKGRSGVRLDIWM